MQTPKGCKREFGICLSGGGFRASFYHIGILIQMAELGMLRHVEVISTVSGGSIVGAAYYLKVKKLLETKPDAMIFDSDYVDLVHELEKEFLEAVQLNLRMRTFANPLTNIRMASPYYSRSDAIGELYEKYIYQKILKPADKWISMRELLIRPENKEIHPCDETLGNKQRINKIPVIIINATSLNSGHNWYFSSRSMGEVPPRNSIFKDIDKKDRYRRISYNEMKDNPACCQLGRAVAASAGVPGLFPPITVANRYKDHVVQLVDGGVFDNQGIYGALDPLHICKHLVVSDASGQNDSVDNPDNSLVKVLALSNSIMMGRIREEVVNGLNAECSNTATHPASMAYFHLTRGLFAKNINAIDQEISEESDNNQREGITSSLEDFQVHEEMQHALAHIRTDLDSFTDIEAGCLVADGYLMSRKSLEELKQLLPDHDPHQSANQIKKEKKWNYKNYIDKLASNDALTLKHLQIAENKFMKPYYHLIKGTLGIKKSFMLILWSLPMLALLAGVLFGLDWLVVKLTEHSTINILTDMNTFGDVMFKIAPALYWLLVVNIFSTVANKFIEGSGKWVRRVRQLLTLPMTLTTMVFTRFILPLMGALPVLLYLVTIDRYFVKVIGKPE